jgi:predicted metal-dependent peptidase
MTANPHGYDDERPDEESAEYKQMLKQAEEKLRAARTHLLSPQQRPYLGAAVWALRWIPRPGLGTFAVDDSWRMYYDPECVVINEVEAIAVVIEHEVWHLLREHGARAKVAGVHDVKTIQDIVKGRLWNWAADAEIHSDETILGRMKTHGLKSPRTEEPWEPITPATLEMEPRLIAETYYNKILTDTDVEVEIEEGESGDVEPGEDEGDEGGPGGLPGKIVITIKPGGAAGEAGIEIEVPIDLPGTPGGQTSNKPAPGEGNCGSGATGQKAAWEDDPDGGPGKTKERVIRRKVAKKIVEHVKTRGVGAGEMIREWAEDYLQGPKISWQEELSTAIQNAVAWVQGSYEYTRTRPSRRQAAQPWVVMPGMIHPIPEVAVVIDTSGSMSEDLLKDALSETDEILRTFGAHMGIKVFAVDDAVGWAGQVYDVNSINLVGGGGTDMGKGVRAAADSVPRPNILIIMTDGYTPWPEHAPEGMQTVIGVVGDKEHVLKRGSDFPEWVDKVIWIEED